MPGTKKQLKRLKKKGTRWAERAFEEDKQSINNKTHFMSYNENLEDGKGYLVYPSVRENAEGKLEELDGEKAYNTARDKGDALQYGNKKKAAKASMYGYKKHGNFPKDVVKKAKKSWKDTNKKYKALGDKNLFY
jgi:hypothetical protein